MVKTRTSANIINEMICHFCSVSMLKLCYYKVIEKKYFLHRLRVGNINGIFVFLKINRKQRVHYLVLGTT